MILPSRWIKKVGISILFGVVGALAAQAEVPLGDSGKVELSGDLRLRLEQDWDSLRADGTERDDRLRARIRLRLGLTYRPWDGLTAGVRLRSGSDHSQQSTHITIVDFDDNDRGDADFNFDKWYLKAKRGGLWGWAGRNSLPIWKPNELFWDDDVTPAGMAFGFETKVADGADLSFNGGYFALPVGMREFSGELAMGQVVLGVETPGKVRWTLAAGGFLIDGDADDTHAAELRRGNGSRDYTIWVANLQVKLLDIAGRPLAFGADYITNSEDYDPEDSDPVTAAHHDETDGHVVYVSWGGTKNKGDWQLAASWARIETLAVHTSYAQDDWMRWGSASQTDSSDFAGFELRAAHALAARQSIVARLYQVEAITSVQDGYRFRIEYNLRF